MIEQSSILTWLSSYNFQVLATLSMVEEIKSMVLLTWVRELSIKTKLNICFLGTVTNRGHFNHTNSHAHLLMAGRNRLGKTLTDCPSYELQESWKNISDFRLVIDLNGIAEYIAKYNISKESGIVSYNEKLLNKIRRT